MRYLGMDTSGSVAAVALYDTEQDLFLSQQSLYTKKTHSQVILPLVERTLQDCGLTAADLDGIAVAVGPGSYTGLRIGVAAVKAMTFALQLPCFGISTLEALAYQAATANGLCSAVMKARQNLVYAGLYQNQNGILQNLVPDGLYEQMEWQQILEQQQVPVLMTGMQLLHLKRSRYSLHRHRFGCKTQRVCVWLLVITNRRLQNSWKQTICSW